MGKSNQKTVKTIKEPCNKQNYYTAINLQALQDAGAVLSGDGFKMWVYFSKNQDGYQQQLSSKHAQETFKLSKRRYDNAIKELIDLGFLVDVNTDPQEVANLWEFHEKALVSGEDKPLQISDTSLDTKDYKPSLHVDTRNNTDTTTTTENNTVPRVEGNQEIQNMTAKQKEEYYYKYIF